MSMGIRTRMNGRDQGVFRLDEMAETRWDEQGLKVCGLLARKAKGTRGCIACCLVVE